MYLGRDQHQIHRQQLWRAFPNEFIRFVDKTIHRVTQHALQCKLTIRSTHLQSYTTDRMFLASKPATLSRKWLWTCLLDDNIKLVSLSGKAGTGKTLLAMAAGLQKVVEETNIPAGDLASHLPLGKDLGYLARHQSREVQSLDATHL
jgi:PhoH-like ATPase